MAMNLKKYRREKGLTQVELAKKLHTTQAVITNYERGLRRPASDKIPELAKALDVTIEQLYGLESVTKVIQAEKSIPNKRSKQMQTIFNELPPAKQRAVLEHAKGLIKR